jgi:hypothetical protein
MRGSWDMPEYWDSLVEKMQKLKTRISSLIQITMSFIGITTNLSCLRLRLAPLREN